MAENIKSSLNTTGRRGNWLGTGGRWVLGAVALALVLFAASTVLVPWAIQSQLPKLAEKALGRAVSVEDVHFKPWALELSLHKLVVAGLAGHAPLLAVDRLKVDVALASLWRLAPVLDAIEIEAPKARLERRMAGKYDIDDLIERFAKPDTTIPSEPVRFALYNVAIRGGSIDFVDTPFNRTHMVSALDMQVPFISNLPVFREIKVEPALSFKLNGSAFDSHAQSTPFATSHKSDAQIRIGGLDLAPYAAYVPAGLPMRLTSGVLDTDLTMVFEQGASHVLRVAGSLKLSQLGLSTAGKAADASTFHLGGLQLDVKELLPFEQKAHISSLTLTQPDMAAARLADGRIPLLDAFQSKSTSQSNSPTAAPATQSAGASKPWSAQLDKLSVTDGAMRWRDASLPGNSQWAVAKTHIDIGPLAWPLVKPAPFKLAANLEATGTQAARLEGEGSATAQQVQFTIKLDRLDLAGANPYLARWLRPKLQGQLATRLLVEWQAGTDAAGASAQSDLTVQELTLDNLALKAWEGMPAPNESSGRANAAPLLKGGSLAAIGQLKVSGAKIRLPQQSIDVATVGVSHVQMPVDRTSGGQWMFEHWLKPQVGDAAAASAAASPNGAPVGASDGTKDWSVTVADLALTDANVQLTDRSTPRSVRLDVSDLAFQARNWVLGGKAATPVSLRAKVASRRLDPGSLDIKGMLSQQPWGIDAAIQASRLPLHALAPYMGTALNLELLRSDASLKGQLKYSQSPAGPVVKLLADAALEDFRANTRGAQLVDKSDDGEELLSWKALGLRGVDVSLAPGTPMRVDVRETVLSDFYARLILRDTGRFNLQDLTGTATPAGTPTASVSASPAATAPSEPPAVINMGGISLVNGKVYFSDRFIKPNYSADLSELTGKLGAFSSQSQTGEVQMADLELRGRAEGTATLEILGKLNPLAKPLAMDIKGKVRELELPPLSAYSVKYSGHAIERGKLSLDVAYQVQPNGELTASNKLVLNSLKFGDKVEGSEASLPVKLAVALLADRNGVIDLDLPVSGSLNDPQFQLGTVIFKVLGNIILKAITSPFSLLAGSIGSGAEEMSTVAFEPGSDRLAADAAKGLDQLAKAMIEREGLSATVVGTASMDVERDAIQHERLRALMQAEKRRATTLGAKPATENAAGNADAISQDEYSVLLKRVYRRADIAKPRNMLGLTKDLPNNEMEALLLANLPVTPDAIQALALARGVAVKEYLAGHKVPVERLFLGAAKSVTPQGKWTPQAEMALSVR